MTKTTDRLITAAMLTAIVVLLFVLTDGFAGTFCFWHR